MQLSKRYYLQKNNVGRFNLFSEINSIHKSLQKIFNHKIIHIFIRQDINKEEQEHLVIFHLY